MKIRPRTIIAVIAVLTSFLTAGATSASVQATPADHPGNGEITVTRESHGEQNMNLPSQTPQAAIAAPAPTTSPAAAQRYYVPYGSGWECESGYACALVRYGAGHYLFKFYYYGTYRLSYWYDWGVYFSNQTGGAAMRLLDINGVQLICAPRSGHGAVNWDPVWYIRLTASPC